MPVQNEYGTLLDRNGYAPSIMQQGDCGCFICDFSHDKLDRHEVFFGADRQKSKRLGLWVLLCHHDCHIFGREAVHNNRANDLALKRVGQAAAMERYGWTTEDFIREFYKNYL